MLITDDSNCRPQKTSRVRFKENRIFPENKDYGQPSKITKRNDENI